MHREDTVRSRVGNFPEDRPVLGEVTETLCNAGTEEVRSMWVLSPGETYPGRECLLAVDSYSPDEF